MLQYKNVMLLYYIIVGTQYFGYLLQRQKLWVCFDPFISFPHQRKKTLLEHLVSSITVNHWDIYLNVSHRLYLLKY